MNKKPFSQLVRWVVTATAIVLPLAILLWLNQGVVSAFIDVVRDREAVIAYLDSLGAIGPLVLMGLIGLQVLIPSLPAEPPMMAAAYAYGFTGGFLMSWVISVAASQAVFCLARYAGRPLVERLVPAKLLGKWTRTAGERGTMFFLLAFVIPPVPSDILIYVAGLSEVEGWHFFVANLFGRMPMIVLLTLVGAYGSSITPAMIVALTAVGIFMLVASLYYVRQSPEAEASSVPSEAGRAQLAGGALLRWRDASVAAHSHVGAPEGPSDVACGIRVTKLDQHLAVWIARPVTGQHRTRRCRSPNGPQLARIPSVSAVPAGSIVPRAP